MKYIIEHEQTGKPTAREEVEASGPAIAVLRHHVERPFDAAWTSQVAFHDQRPTFAFAEAETEGWTCTARVIHDAIVPVSCDGKGCGAHLEIQPEVVYSDYSGKKGRYDTSDAAIEAKIIEEGWRVHEGNKHYCEDCDGSAGR